MRHGLKKLLALALVLGAMAFALAEGIDLGEGIEQPEEAPAEQGEVALGFEESEPEAPTVATYWFMVDDTIYAEQQALEGDALMQPADPEAPRAWPSSAGSSSMWTRRARPRPSSCSPMRSPSWPTSTPPPR